MKMLFRELQEALYPSLEGLILMEDFAEERAFAKAQLHRSKGEKANVAGGH